MNHHRSMSAIIKLEDEATLSQSTYPAAAARDIVHSHKPVGVDHNRLVDIDSRPALDTPSLTYESNINIRVLAPSRGQSYNCPMAS